MTSNYKIIKELNIEFDERRILRLIGYKSRNSGGFVKKIIAEEKKRLPSFLHPLSLYAIIGYGETNKHSIYDHAEKVALCICTIGKELEEESADLMKNNEMLRAIILDALGSEAAEEAAIQSDNAIAREALGMGLWPSKRFSPGYGKWDIREQKFVFDILPAEKIGVRLNESFMMVPRKSISFRINLYSDRKYTTRKISP